MANALSHGLGLVLILAFSPLLFLKAGQSNITGLPLAISCYVFGLLMVFTFSTLYHATFHPEAKRILRVFDHISIYFLTLGTYIPFVFLHADPARAKWLMSLQAGIVLFGIILKTLYTGKFKTLSIILYVAQGVLVLGMGKTFWSSLPQLPLILLLFGGLLYLIGVFFYQKKSWVYHHVLWHFFVLAAAISHFLSVYLSF